MEVLAKVTLSSDTNLAADSVVNTFAFSNVDDMTDFTLDSISEALQAFYRTIPTGGLAPLADYLSPVLSNATLGSTVDIYDITGKLAQDPVTGKMPLVGSPAFTESFTLQAPAPGGVTPLPSEVAYVVTLEAFGREDAPVELDDDADFGAERNRPKQRHTGRLYLGPLNSLCTQVVSGVCRPSAALRDTARLAVAQLASTVFGANGALLAVWSRKDGVLRTVDNVSVDDSFDTQRRRGEKASVRLRYDL